ncbi:hypothetical protein Ct61P_07579 [Colletotrichum tofieldiae]|nr:hypothetical protein Ct61P_07579 [Colletotrichum tofieldiae]
MAPLHPSGQDSSCPLEVARTSGGKAFLSGWAFYSTLFLNLGGVYSSHWSNTEETHEFTIVQPFFSPSVADHITLYPYRDERFSRRNLAS